jgi:hypothetical protein
MCVVNVIGWVCLSCRDIVRSRLETLQMKQSDLAGTVEQLKEDIAKLHQDVISCRQTPVASVHVPVTWPSLPPTKEQIKQLQAVLHADLEDSKRRQCNIVVSGLTPKHGTDDVNLFLNVCERNLSLKPYVIRNKSKRLGRPQIGKIQPLLICLNNAQTANELLRAAKQLRRSNDEEIRTKVFINPDPTPGEAQAAFERRQRRRQRTGHRQNADRPVVNDEDRRGEVYRLHSALVGSDGALSNNALDANS